MNQKLTKKLNYYYINDPNSGEDLIYNVLITKLTETQLKKVGKIANRIEDESKGAYFRYTVLENLIKDGYFEKLRKRGKLVKIKSPHQDKNMIWINPQEVFVE